MQNALTGGELSAIRLPRDNAAWFSYHGVKNAIQTAPLLRSLMEYLYERQFARDSFGACRGVYRTFSEADRSAPRTKPLGFNNAAYALVFGERSDKLFSFDYPMLFWLDRLMRTGLKIFDFGGHVGNQFHAYSRYLDYPRGVSWVVCDLPEITRAAEALARNANQPALSFTNRFEDAEGADVLIAAGAVQYVESPPFAVSLEKLNRRPRHLLLNKLPLYDGEQFVTLQNGGAAFHPQYVFNRASFVDSLTALGYRVEDRWDVDSHKGVIPFHPEKSFAAYSGMYLTLGGETDSCS